MAIGVLATACTGASDPTTVPPTTTAGSATTEISATAPGTTATTVAAATTTSAVQSPPPLANESEDWEAVWTSMMEVRDWISANPDQRETMFDVFAPDCPCLDEELAFIDGLAELGLASSQSPVDILDIEEIARPRDDRVVLTIEMYRPPFTLVTMADGAVYQEDLGDWTETLAVSLNRFDGRWLIQSLEVTERVLGT